MPVDQQSGLLFSDAFTSRLTVAASDIDAFSHVNNAVYLKWMNDCAMEHSASVGLPAEACVDLDRGMAVRETRLVYQRPARLGDGVIIANWVTFNDGRLRANRYFQVARASDHQTLLLGASKYVCIALSTGKPARMPDVFAKAYQVEPGLQRRLVADAGLRAELII